jgi:hypothetical protein
MRFRRMPSLRWHYPDQVYGSDLSRAFLERSTPWLEFLKIAGVGMRSKFGGNPAPPELLGVEQMADFEQSIARWVNLDRNDIPPAMP